MARCQCSSCACHSCSEDNHNQEHNYEQGQKNGKLKKVLFITGAAVFALAIIFQILSLTFISVIFYAAAYILIGFDTFCCLYKALCDRDFFGETTLMVVSSLGAMIIGEMAEGCMVMLLFEIGEILEVKAKGKSKRNIKLLLELKPKFALKRTGDGREERVRPEKLSVGDIVIVKAGDTVPCDGEVISGTANADTSSITGESVPRVLSTGDGVRCGYISLDGALEIRVTTAYADNTFSKILEIVAGNSGKKSKSESFVKKFARIYTPAVMLAALLVMFLGSIVTGDVKVWIYRGLVFLATSCPCAFIISVPLTFFFGIGEMSRIGLLIKGSEYIEKLSKVRTFAFDKTGTLTKGRLRVVNAEFLTGFEKEEVLSFCASLENSSNHPIARQIVSFTREQGVTLYTAAQVTEIPGVGISGEVLSKKVFAGNKKGITDDTDFDLSENTAKVYISVDGKAAGVIELCDEIRPEVPQVIRALRECGVRRTVMLSGDTAQNAKNTGAVCGIDEIHSELLPQKKSEILENIIKSSPGEVAFVGDGINDAPVLALADVGIAVGTDGAHIAVETADAVILGSSLEALSRGYRGAKCVVSRARFNVIFAISTKLAILVLTLLGYANMWVAVFGDVGVTVLVILNALRKLKV